MSVSTVCMTASFVLRLPAALPLACWCRWGYVHPAGPPEVAIAEVVKAFEEVFAWGAEHRRANVRSHRKS